MLTSTLRVSALTFAALLAGCGVEHENSSDVRIIGGEDVADDQDDSRRWSTVALTSDLVAEVEEPSMLAGGKSFCTGTVIAKRVILTAAHCLQEFDPETHEKEDNLLFPSESDFLVFFGTKVNDRGEYIRAAKVIPHPDWSPAETLRGTPRSAPNDIGIVILEEDIPDSYKPARLAPTDLEIEEDEDVMLAGYGVTRRRTENDTGTLRQVHTPYQSESSTAQRFTVGAWNRGACGGDSGGPAYVVRNGETFVVGATSTGAEFAGNCLGITNNYTDVRYYHNWIADAAGNHF